MIIVWKNHPSVPNSTDSTRVETCELSADTFEEERVLATIVNAARTGGSLRIVTDEVEIEYSFHPGTFNEDIK